MAGCWHQGAKPILGGCFGGLLLSFAVMALIHGLTGGEPEWFNDVIALTWCGGGFAIYYWLLTRAMSRRRLTTLPLQAITDRAVRAQVRRIRGKCARLVRVASRSAGPYSDLTRLAPELAEHARRLGDCVIALRAAAREVQADMSAGPSPIPPGASSLDPALQQEYAAAVATQERLSAALAENANQQQLLLTRLERIEDLVDTARLEASRPSAPPATAVAPGLDRPASVVEEVDGELQAARRALEELERRDE